MGLFNRGFKSNLPSNGQPPSANDDVPEEGAMPSVDPATKHDEAAQPEQTTPAESPVDQTIPAEPPADQTIPAESPADQTIPAESPADQTIPAESPADQVPPADPAPGVTQPPVNPAPPDPDDEGRITAHEALAPTRGPATSRPPGAHIGDESERRARIISFANQKGGVAKTTTTLNLAVAFAESGHQVLVVDLDPQGNLTMSQGIDPDKVEGSMYDVLVDHIPIREVIHRREIDVAVASIDLAGAEIAMSMQIGRERSLEKALATVVDDYDFICIDTPPSLGLLTVNALTASDKVIVPVQCEYLSMRGLVQLQNTMQMIRENLNPRVHIEGILPTMLDSRTVHAKEAVEILEENFGEMVFKSRIRKAIKFAEAPVRGSSVLKYDPNGNAANYYRELAKEVLTNGAS
jgi:chromosome partitioning protein